MNLKDFTVQSEAEDTYHLRHPSGQTFTVEKKGLSPKAQKEIQALCSGGGVQKMASGGTSVPLMLDPNAPESLPGPQPTPADIAVDAVSAPPEKAFPMPTADEIYQKKLADRMATIPPGEAYDQWRQRAPELVVNEMNNQNDAHKTAVQQQAEDVVAQNSQRARAGLAPLPVPSVPGAAPSGAQSAPQMPAQQDGPNPFAQRGSEMEGALNRQEGGVRNYMKEIGDAGKQSQAAYQDFINKQSQMQTPDQVMADYKSKDDALMHHFMDAQVDPNRYLHNMSTGSKIIAAIGMIFGGAAAGANGKNNGIELLNRAIDQDIDSQKNAQGKAMNLWKMNREQSKDEMQAHLMTQNQLLTGVQAKVAMAGAQTQNIEARFRGTELINQIEQQKAQNRFQLGLMSGGASGGNMDPSVMVSSLVPKEHQAKVFAEIQAGQNTAKMGDSILAAFEKAAKENTVMKTGAGYLRTPASVGALHQAMQPTFADLEGTVRQAAMDNTFHNITPAPGDSDYTIQTKRQALREYLQSKASAPTAKGFGIDLSKFHSTTSDPVARMNPQEQTYYQWAKANPSSPVAIAFMKKKGFQ